MNQELINTIRSKVDIVDIIGERLTLKSRGKNLFCSCPFHGDGKEQIESMAIYRDSQMYHCFGGCDKSDNSGNVFKFLMKYEDWDFPTTLKYLADRVGIDIGNVSSSKNKPTKFDKYYEAYQLSLKYYQNNLNSSKGKEAKKYLESRQIGEDLIKEFEIGLSLNERDDLTKLLVNKKFDLVTLNRIGLSNDDHDIYSDRIMFPLYDTQGRVVGFSGRIYKDNGQNKYVNTTGTDIFKKGEILYHYHIAKEECKKIDSVIIMEGFMDVIRASSIGVRNTVALMGTALTKEHLALLHKLSNNVYLCLDGDQAGVKAMLGLGDMLIEAGFNLKIIELPDPDDPDSFILREGKDAFLKLMNSAFEFIDYKMSKLKSKINFNSRDEKNKYIYSVIDETSKINDPLSREEILKRLAKECDIEYNTLEMLLKEKLDHSDDKKEEKIVFLPKTKSNKNRYTKAFEQILFYMLHYDWVITFVEKEHIVFPNEIERLICSEIIYYYKKYGNINVADFYTYVQDRENILIFLNNIMSEGYMEETTKEELYLLFGVAKEYMKKQEINRLTNLMEKEVDPIEQSLIVEKIRKLRLGDSENG